MRNAISKLILCFISIIISLLIGEIIVRHFRLAPTIFHHNVWGPYEFVDNARICYKMKPYGSGRALNSEGFRDKEFFLKKEKDEFRIIMLGDSITVGPGISCGETFSEQLENLLNQKSEQFGKKNKYNVMNFGVGGYNIVSEVEILKVYGLKYKPDIVVLNYFWNDNEEYSWDYWVFLNNENTPVIEKNLAYQYYSSSVKFKFQRLLFQSHLFVFCWVRFNNLFKQWGEFKNVEPTCYKEDIIFKKLLELKNLARRFHFKLLVCMHPILDYDRNEPHHNYKSTKNIVEMLNIPYIDLILFYKSESKDPGLFLKDIRDTFHPNVTGHTLIAKVLLVELERTGFIIFGN